jgi:hypothetical protein
MTRRWGLLGGVAIVVGWAVACGGSSDTSAFGDGTNGNGNGNGGEGGTGFGGNGGGNGGNGGGGNVGTVGGVTPGSACATSNAGATRPPAYLVFMYDRSASMNESVGNGQTKWTACQTALEDFFSSPTSAGIHASLTFFGQNLKADSTDCSTASYTTPQVAMTALPDATSFSAQINATKPSTDTPTLAAMQGAIQYAQTIKPTDGGKVAIVLVTDGDPNGCNGNSVGAISSAAAAVAATIPTYVVGIGNSLTNLQQIAMGGGTKAIAVSTSSPMQTTSDLENALGTIAASQLGCQYGLPAPPMGQTLDVNSVNVDYTPSGGAQTTLTYSADCSDPNGWHYDTLMNPTQIIMCPTICNTLTADKGGKVDIIFGCSTSAGDGGPPVK